MFAVVNANVDLGQILIGLSLLVTAAAGAGLIGRQLKGITQQVNGRRKDAPTISQDISEATAVIKDAKETLAALNATVADLQKSHQAERLTMDDMQVKLHDINVKQEELGKIAHSNNEMITNHLAAHKAESDHQTARELVQDTRNAADDARREGGDSNV